MNNELYVTLQNALSADSSLRIPAEQFLNQTIETNHDQFLLVLCSEFANEQQNNDVRQLVGLYIKNLITANDQFLKQQKLNRWMNCNYVIKEQVKQGFLLALQSSNPVVSHTAAQIIAAYGACDLPKHQWEALLPTLSHCIIKPDIAVQVKTSALQAIGYLCDDRSLDPDMIDASISNIILTSLVEGLKTSNQEEVILAAIEALNTSLIFTENNFKVPVERDIIMSNIYTTTQNSNPSIRAMAYECLVTVAQLYYDEIESYMETLYTLTLNSIQNDDENIAKQAIEFWTTVCEGEIDRRDDQDTYHHLIEKVAPTLVPVLISSMTKQNEDPENDDYIISSSAQECLYNISLLLEDGILPLVLPYVTSNINAEDWRVRLSALLAFGTIMEGPSIDSNMLSQAIPIIVTNMRTHPKIQVRDTAAWTIGNMFSNLELGDQQTYGVGLELMAALDDSSAIVASQVCYALHYLAESQRSGDNEDGDDDSNPDSILSHLMIPVLQKLLTTTERPDADFHNLRRSAYEAVNQIIESSGNDMQHVVSHVLVEAISRLEKTFHGTTNTTSEASKSAQLSICSVVGSSIKRLHKSLIPQFADRIMQLLLQVVAVSTGASTYEDAWLAIGYTCNKLERSFEPYVQFVMPHLHTGLSKIYENSSIMCCSGVVGDICRAIGGNFNGYANDIMKQAIDIFYNDGISRSVKPAVISMVADVVTALEDQFVPYVSHLAQMLKHAGSISVVNPEDDDEAEFIIELRTSVNDGYTAIVQHLGRSQPNLVLPFVPEILRYLHAVCVSVDYSDLSEDLLKSYLGLIGDVGQVFEDYSVVQAFYCDNKSLILQLVQSLQSDETIDDDFGDWIRSTVKDLTK